jgi:predicted SAM-dependent methyltransferase
MTQSAYNPQIGPDEEARIDELLRVPIFNHRPRQEQTHRSIYTTGHDQWWITYGNELSFSGPFSDSTVQRMAAAGRLIVASENNYCLSDMPSASRATPPGFYLSERDPAAIVNSYLERTPAGSRGINLGCGGATISGWLNIDTAQPWHLDILWDLNQGLPPIPAASFDTVYSEAFWEHISRPVAMRLLRDSLKCLRPGGHIRIAMPDLDDVIANYHGGGTIPSDEKGEFIEEFGPLLHTSGEWLNIAMRAWGHTYIYTFQDISLVLEAAGFIDVRREQLGSSSVSMLADRETRPVMESSLIVEARKPD